MNPLSRSVAPTMSDELFMQAVAGSKYPLDAFQFVKRGLDFAVHRVHGNPKPDADPASLHIDGRVLCHSLRDYAIEQYGLLARTVLNRWHINSCRDFGNIVFIMVDAKVMSKTPTDSIRDFIDVYDFDEAFTCELVLTGN